jgi:VanZ family protein
MSPSPFWSNRIKYLLKLPALLAAGAIWIASSQSVVPRPRGIPGFDKALHLTAYAGLAVALALWYSREQWRTRRFQRVVLIVLIASLYGISDEIHQYFVPGRDCSVWDWIADVLGAVLGAGAAALICRNLDNPKEHDV